MKLTAYQMAAFLDLLWQQSAKSKLQTGWGPKTRQGLLASIETILNEPHKGEQAKTDVSGAIAGMLDGKEWSVDTLDEIADVLRAAGYQVRDSADCEDEA